MPASIVAGGAAILKRSRQHKRNRELRVLLHERPIAGPAGANQVFDAPPLPASEKAGMRRTRAVAGNSPLCDSVSQIDRNFCQDFQAQHPLQQTQLTARIAGLQEQYR